MKPVSAVNHIEERSAEACCGRRAHFRNDLQEIEAAFPGLTAMSSAFGSTRAQDGLCDRLGVYLGAADVCAEFEEGA